MKCDMSQFSAEVKEWIQLYFCSTLVPSRQVTQFTFTPLPCMSHWLNRRKRSWEWWHSRLPNIGLRMNTRLANIKQPRRLDTNRMQCITITTDIHVNRTAWQLAGIYRGGTVKREQLQGDRRSTDRPALCKISTKQKTAYIYFTDTPCPIALIALWPHPARTFHKQELFH